MKITVEYLAQLKQLTNTAKDEFVFDHPVFLPELIEKIILTHGQQLNMLRVDTPEANQSSILVGLNDKQIQFNYKLKLTDGDRITFLAPMSGG